MKSTKPYVGEQENLFVWYYAAGEGAHAVFDDEGGGRERTRSQSF